MLPFFFVQIKLHQEVMMISLLIMRRESSANILFFIFFLPGIVLHEGSHWLAAKLLRVPVGDISVKPKMLRDGRIRLGYVETAQTDWVRDTLIGAAPIIFGMFLIAWIAAGKMNIIPAWEAFTTFNLKELGDSLKSIFQTPDFWIWFYLVFSISSMMLPSPSDRHAWLPLTLVVLVIFILLIAAGAGTWMQTYLLPVVNSFLACCAPY